MGILDEAIREHLELKRSHGADDSEIKELEDDAFGPPQRPGAEEAPDPAAEAATEFMSQPDLGGEGKGEEPPADAAPPAADAVEKPPARREGGVGIADLQEAPLRAEEPDDDDEDDDVAEEAQPAAEHEAIKGPVGPTTEERHAIADQPTEMFDVEEEFASSEAPAPPDEDLVAEEIAEPRLAPAPDPLPEPEEDEEDDFFDEQRLSDELDQALEAPLEEEESAEHEVIEAKEKPREPKPEPTGEHDALEETPDFLEEAPEDDELWFEQKPPKDFDFDD